NRHGDRLRELRSHFHCSSFLGGSSVRTCPVHCIPPLGRFARRAGFVALRQTFVRPFQHCVGWAAATTTPWPLLQNAGEDARRRRLSADAITAALAPSAGHEPFFGLGVAGEALSESGT